MTSPSPLPDDRSLSRPPESAAVVAGASPVDDWASMGQAFEGLCKAGLALTVGFSVAAAFCRMMDAKNADVTGVVGRLATSVFARPQEKGPDKRG